MMMRHLLSHRLALMAVLLALGNGPAAFAQASDEAEREILATSPVDDLLDALRDEAHPEPARLSRRIAELWSQSGSDSIDFLLNRGRAAIEARELDKAVEHLTAVVEIEPDFAEGWNARATAYYLQNDYWSAVADIVKVLEIEPRHYGALAGLAIMLERTGAEASALAAHRAALAVNPHLEGAREAVRRLAPQVDGRDI